MATVPSQLLLEGSVKVTRRRGRVVVRFVFPKPLLVLHRAVLSATPHVEIRMEPKHARATATAMRRAAAGSSDGG